MVVLFGLVVGVLISLYITIITYHSRSHDAHQIISCAIIDSVLYWKDIILHHNMYSYLLYDWNPCFSKERPGFVVCFPPSFGAPGAAAYDLSAYDISYVILFVSCIIIRSIIIQQYMDMPS